MYVLMKAPIPPSKLTSMTPSSTIISPNKSTLVSEYKFGRDKTQYTNPNNF